MTSYKLMKFHHLLTMQKFGPCLSSQLVCISCEPLRFRPASDFAESNQIGGQSPRGDVRRPGDAVLEGGDLVSYQTPPIKGISIQGRGSGKLPTWTSLSSNESLWKTIQGCFSWEQPSVENQSPFCGYPQGYHNVAENTTHALRIKERRWL